jgi:hypothetical protein
MRKYIRQLVDITTKYGKLVDGADDINNLTNGSIMVYLMNIHPRQYPVVGSLNISDDETEMLNLVWDNETYIPKSLFGH